ncbi:hypothetical protein [cf. Phormidesmis sp. LEGE 11477]|uniref:hypothetical protein n=1 Tax=cf. Phormidesmis sp. LEGE 11477 TaxID=1828680 RepID=UPI00188119A8|nr:hypothetical protein [cf. Phormidesmis sp. LEGE 11477]MBE9061185.1 hypothetical protein [cf. Phormidesmis sp. LEGE 11477]
MASVNSDFNSDDSQQPEDPITLEEISIETVQRRHAGRLTQHIEQLEAERSRLEAEKDHLQSQIDALQADYTQLISLTQTLRQLADTDPDRAGPSAETSAASELLIDTSAASAAHTQRVNPWTAGPLLPGESEPPTPETTAASQDRTLELPTPATSEQRRQRLVQQQIGMPLPSATGNVAVGATGNGNRGLILSVITTLITALHYCIFGTLSQGGTWFDLVDIGQLGAGFLPSTAFLWLRMLVILPGLVLLAPQLYRNTWHDLHDWFYIREQLLWPVVASGTALFLSQVLLYQSIGLMGAAISSALLFLYPLTDIPSRIVFRQPRSLTPFGLLALVAIAMGGWLVGQPVFVSGSSSQLWIGLLASAALSLYILLTNFCYRQRCHPIPTSIVQFSTVSLISSLVLLIKPLQLVDLSGESFFLWGLLVGLLMLIAYLLNYASLLATGPRTAIVAATTPLVTLLLSLSFMPVRSLEIIQWTGIMMITVGGIALAKEKLSKEQIY